MDAFTADYLTNLAAELSAPIIAKVAQRFQAKWQGDESSQALQRCLHAGVVGMVSKANLDAPDYEALLSDIFTEFFGNTAVARELTRLVYLQPLSVPELEEVFVEAGYDPETLPGLDFPAAVAAFEAAFLEWAATEKVLQPIIQVHQGWAQTDLQREMVALMRQMVAALQALQPGQAVGILADRIVAENVVSGVQNNIFQWRGDSAPDLSARNSYLAWLMNERKTLPLRAISAGKAGGGERPPELAQVYVALNTTTQVEKKGEKRRPGEAEQEPLAALPAVAANRCVILLGDPGSGKSTFVTHLAYCLAAHALYPNDNWLSHLPGWPAAKADLLPLLIVLRDFARWLPDPLPAKAHVHHLWDFVGEMLHKEKLEGALPLVEQALNDGRALLLLDGLDEVTSVAQRRFVRDAVQAFAGRYDRCPLLITCRIFSYQEPDRDKEEEDLRLPAAAFPVFQLAEFTEPQRDAFIHAWYGELKRQGHLPGQDIAPLIRDLRQAIRRSDLRRMAGNPLLLTVMAVVHVDDGRLPDSRALLYNKTVDLLLSRWEETKGEGETPRLRQLLQEAGRTDLDLKTRLAEVAFTVHTQAGTATDEEKVSDIGEAYLCQELSRLHKKQLGWGQELLAVIKTRAGLLIERSPGQFAFPHRTFQEYLAGVYLASQPDFAARALDWARQDVAWWPMVLFAVEHLVYVNERPQDPLPLISDLCPPQLDDTTAGWRLLWLAGEALVSLGVARAGDSEWGQILLERVRQRLAQLIEGEQLPPRERAAVGRALAQVGDPRPGVGVLLREGVKLPDIAWGEEVPAGTYTIGGDKQAFRSFDKRPVEIKHPYRLSRYPITFAQFQCFVEAADFGDGRWWADMPKTVTDWNNKNYPVWEIAEQRFSYASHPRDMVSWYQAVAFCRWLSDKLGITVQLPHEYEWEVAARYPHGRAYPWGDDFDSEKTNTDESRIGQTTAVGLYPSGRNAALNLYDLSGNVWEWCCNKYNDPKDEAVDVSGAVRVLRGGSGSSMQTSCARPTAPATTQTTASTTSVFGWWWCVVPHLILISDLCSCLRNGNGAGDLAPYGARDRSKFSPSPPVIPTLRCLRAG